MTRGIYANSTYTVAATASKSPDQDLFRLRDPAAIVPELIKAPTMGPWLRDVEYFLFDRSFLNGMRNLSHWHAAADTYEGSWSFPGSHGLCNFIHTPNREDRLEDCVNMARID
ncbi:putative Heterokaryon incompatibility protein [Seiridium unicorne]|uniref:Heterokaryon incompatibility protein n=1 Tax=Seiridium unicorne TaxID=138068 RepID=A0ABR2UK21_9PEZI